MVRTAHLSGGPGRASSSPGALPPPSPYLSEYSNSPAGFSPAAFSEPPPSPWPSVGVGGGGGGGGGGSGGTGAGSGNGGSSVGSGSASGVGGGGGGMLGGLGDAHDAEAPTVNQRNALKWEVDEALGLGATISAVLYANTNHPELKRDFSRKMALASSLTLKRPFT